MILAGLRQPRKRVKFSQRYFAEEVALRFLMYSLDTCVRYFILPVYPIWKFEKSTVIVVAAISLLLAAAHTSYLAHHFTCPVEIYFSAVIR